MDKITISFSDLMTGIVAFLGAGGASIIVAYYGFKKAREERDELRKTQQQSSNPMAALGAELAVHYGIERLTAGMERLATAYESNTAAIKALVQAYEIRTTRQKKDFG